MVSGVGLSARYTLEVLYWRQPTALERYVDLKVVDNSLDVGRDNLDNVLTEIQRRQVRKLFEVAKKFAARGEYVDPEKLDIPFRAEVAKAILGVMLEMFENGQSQVEEESKRAAKLQQLAKRKKEYTYPNERTRVWQKTYADIKKVFNLKANALAGVFNSTIKGNAALLIARIADEPINEFSDDELEALENDVINAVKTVVRTNTGTIVNDSLNTGRATAAQQLGVTYAEYSAILDKNTCGPCEELDTKRFKIDSAEYHANMPPYKNCKGRDRCRCVYIYDFLSDAEDEAA